MSLLLSTFNKGKQIYLKIKTNKIGIGVPTVACSGLRIRLQHFRLLWKCVFHPGPGTVLPHLWLRLQVWLGFIAQSRNFHMLGVPPFKKKKKKKKRHFNLQSKLLSLICKERSLKSDLMTGLYLLSAS